MMKWSGQSSVIRQVNRVKKQMIPPTIVVNNSGQSLQMYCGKNNNSINCSSSSASSPSSSFFRAQRDDPIEERRNSLKMRKWRWWRNMRDNRSEGTTTTTTATPITAVESRRWRKQPQSNNNTSSSLFPGDSNTAHLVGDGDENDDHRDDSRRLRGGEKKIINNVPTRTTMRQSSSSSSSSSSSLKVIRRRQQMLQRLMEEEETAAATSSSSLANSSTHISLSPTTTTTTTTSQGSTLPNEKDTTVSNLVSSSLSAIPPPTTATTMNSPSPSNNTSKEEEEEKLSSPSSLLLPNRDLQRLLLREDSPIEQRECHNAIGDATTWFGALSALSAYPDVVFGGGNDTTHQHHHHQLQGRTIAVPPETYDVLTDTLLLHRVVEASSSSSSAVAAAAKSGQQSEHPLSVVIKAIEGDGGGGGGADIEEGGRWAATEEDVDAYVHYLAKTMHRQYPPTLGYVEVMPTTMPMSTDHILLPSSSSSSSSSPNPYYSGNNDDEEGRGGGGGGVSVSSFNWNAAYENTVSKTTPTSTVTYRSKNNNNNGEKSSSSSSSIVIVEGRDTHIAKTLLRTMLQQYEQDRMTASSSSSSSSSSLFTLPPPTTHALSNIAKMDIRWHEALLALKLAQRWSLRGRTPPMDMYERTMRLMSQPATEFGSRPWAKCLELYSEVRQSGYDKDAIPVTVFGHALHALARRTPRHHHHSASNYYKTTKSELPEAVWRSALQVLQDLFDHSHDQTRPDSPGTTPMTTKVPQAAPCCVSRLRGEDGMTVIEGALHCAASMGRWDLAASFLSQTALDDESTTHALLVPTPDCVTYAITACLRGGMYNYADTMRSVFGELKMDWWEVTPEVLLDMLQAMRTEAARHDATVAVEVVREILLGAEEGNSSSSSHLSAGVSSSCVTDRRIAVGCARVLLAVTSGIDDDVTTTTPTASPKVPSDASNVEVVPSSAGVEKNLLLHHSLSSDLWHLALKAFSDYERMTLLNNSDVQRMTKQQEMAEMQRFVSVVKCVFRCVVLLSDGRSTKESSSSTSSSSGRQYYRRKREEEEHCDGIMKRIVSYVRERYDDNGSSGDMKGFVSAEGTRRRGSVSPQSKCLPELLVYSLCRSPRRSGWERTLRAWMQMTSTASTSVMHTQQGRRRRTATSRNDDEGGDQVEEAMLGVSLSSPLSSLVVAATTTTTTIASPLPQIRSEVAKAVLLDWRRLSSSLSSPQPPHHGVTNEGENVSSSQKNSDQVATTISEEPDSAVPSSSPSSSSASSWKTALEALNEHVFDGIFSSSHRRRHADDDEQEQRERESSSQSKTMKRRKRPSVTTTTSTTPPPMVVPPYDLFAKLTMHGGAATKEETLFLASLSRIGNVQEVRLHRLIPYLRETYNLSEDSAEQLLFRSSKLRLIRKKAIDRLEEMEEEEEDGDGCWR